MGYILLETDDERSSPWREAGLPARVVGAMDCVDKLVSEVARNEIWREHIRKEDAIASKVKNQSTYRLNLSKLTKNVMAPKPTARQVKDDAPVVNGSADGQVVEQVLADLEKQTSPRPAARTSVPPTASGEVGWMLGYSKSVFQKRWRRDRAMSDVTKYADQSWRLGRSPFVKTNISGGAS